MAPILTAAEELEGFIKTIATDNPSLMLEPLLNDQFISNSEDSIIINMIWDHVTFTDVPRAMHPIDTKVMQPIMSASMRKGLKVKAIQVHDYDTGVTAIIFMKSRA